MSKRPSDLAIVLALVAATIVAYAGVASAGFVAFDDDRYVVRNPQVRAGLTPSGVAWAFTTGYESNWHPLTWLSHMTDVTLFGPGPRGPHAVNVLLHAASAVLLFMALRRGTGDRWPSAAVAALFALHPLHVESVAWVAERKDVLSGLLAMGSLLAYVSWARSGGAGWPRAATALLAAGLLAKPMLVTLPLVFLLFDRWPLERWGSLVPRLREKAWAFALTGASCAVTLYVQAAGGAVKPLRDIPLDTRLANAAISTVGYLRRTVWPVDLAVYYPYPPGGYAALQVVVALAVVGAITAAVTAARRHPYLPVGWGWYLIMLVPVIGIVQVGNQALADRYTYLPLVGIFVLLAWGAAEVARRWPQTRPLVASAAVLVPLVLGGLTWHQVGFWKDSETLFRHAIAVTPPNAAMHYNLGTVLAASGRTAEAKAEYEHAVAIDPRHLEARVNLAGFLAADGRLEEAEARYAAIVREDPTFDVAVASWGAALVRLGRTDEAIERYRELLARNPRSVAGQVGLANLHFAAGRLEEAAIHYENAIRLDPGQATARFNLGVIRAGEGRFSEAIEHYEAVLRADPRDAEARRNLDEVRRARASATPRR